MKYRIVTNGLVYCIQRQRKCRWPFKGYKWDYLCADCYGSIPLSYSTLSKAKEQLENSKIVDIAIERGFYEVGELK